MRTGMPSTCVLRDQRQPLTLPSVLVCAVQRRKAEPWSDRDPGSGLAATSATSPWVHLAAGAVRPFSSLIPPMSTRPDHPDKLYQRVPRGGFRSCATKMVEQLYDPGSTTRAGAAAAFSCVCPPPCSRPRQPPPTRWRIAARVAPLPELEPAATRHRPTASTGRPSGSPAARPRPAASLVPMLRVPRRGHPA